MRFTQDGLCEPVEWPGRGILDLPYVVPSVATWLSYINKVTLGLKKGPFFLKKSRSMENRKKQVKNFWILELLEFKYLYFLKSEIENFLK